MLVNELGSKNAWGWRMGEVSQWGALYRDSGGGLIGVTVGVGNVRQKTGSEEVNSQGTETSMLGGYPSSVLKSTTITMWL